MSQQPKTNERAPELALPDENGDLVRLSDFQGKNVVLAFYPGDWTRVCTAELSLIQETLDQIHDYDAEVLAVSCDTSHSHREWTRELGITFPVLSDFWPHGEGARRYGVFLNKNGVSNRALFFIDRDGILRDSWVAEDPDIAPGLDVIMKTLESMNHDGDSEWRNSLEGKRESTHAR
jgi:peroxiredoxin